MARRSKAAQARFEKRKVELEGELAKYQKMVRELRESGESMLAKTQKQKLYHSKIRQLQSQIQEL